MSLYDLWRFQIGFAAFLAAEGVAAAVLGFSGVWPPLAALALAFVGLSSAALVIPRHGAPERPSNA